MCVGASILVGRTRADAPADADADRVTLDLRWARPVGAGPTGSCNDESAEDPPGQKKVSTSRRLVPTRVGSVSRRSSGRPARLTHSVV